MKYKCRRIVVVILYMNILLLLINIKSTKSSPPIQGMNTLLNNMKDDTNNGQQQQSTAAMYSIPSMNDINHKTLSNNNNSNNNNKNDLLTVSCVNARRRFNSDMQLMKYLMEFYNANQHLSNENCINQKTKELQNCDLTYKWKKLDILNQECKRGHGKTCFETLKITTTTPRRTKDQYGGGYKQNTYILRNLIAGCVPRECEDPRDQSTSMVMIAAVCNMLNIKCDVNCVEWECKMLDANAKPSIYAKTNEEKMKQQQQQQQSTMLRNNNNNNNNNGALTINSINDDPSSGITRFTKCLKNSLITNPRQMMQGVPLPTIEQTQYLKPGNSSSSSSSSNTMTKSGDGGLRYPTD